MKRCRFFIAGIFLITLCACVAPQQAGKSPAGTSGEAKSAAASSPGAEAGTASSVDVPVLACAEVIKAEEVTIRYAAETIYPAGSALPHKEGLACLEGLADWLQSVPQIRWQVTSAGEANVGFDPQALAGKRQELLKRYFARKGIAAQAGEWQALAGQGPQLQLQLLAN